MANFLRGGGRRGDREEKRGGAVPKANVKMCNVNHKRVNIIHLPYEQWTTHKPPSNWTRILEENRTKHLNQTPIWPTLPPPIAAPSTRDRVPLTDPLVPYIVGDSHNSATLFSFFYSLCVEVIVVVSDVHRRLFQCSWWLITDRQWVIILLNQKIFFFWNGLKSAGRNTKGLK